MRCDEVVDLLRSPQRDEDPLVAADRQFRVGAFFSSPLSVGGVVFVGSTDGYLCALR